MKILTILFLIYAFIKAWYYAIYEKNENKNKSAATAIFILAVLRTNFPNNYYNFSVLIFYAISI